MGFIEKITNLWRDDAQPEPAQANVEEQENHVPDVETEEIALQDSEPKQSYTPEEVEEIIRQRQEEWEKSRFEKVADTLKEEASPEERRIAELEKQIQQNDLKHYVVQELGKNKIPLVMAEFLDYTDKERTEKSLAKMSNIFTEAVNQAVTERLRGKTPPGLGKQLGAKTTQDDFTRTIKGL